MSSAILLDEVRLFGGRTQRPGLIMERRAVRSGVCHLHGFGISGQSGCASVIDLELFKGGSRVDDFAGTAHQDRVAVAPALSREDVIFTVRKSSQIPSKRIAFTAKCFCRK
jgi:hypothetical protein